MTSNNNLNKTEISPLSYTFFVGLKGLASAGIAAVLAKYSLEVDWKSPEVLSVMKSQFISSTISEVVFTFLRDKLGMNPDQEVVHIVTQMMNAVLTGGLNKLIYRPIAMKTNGVEKFYQMNEEVYYSALADILAERGITLSASTLGINSPMIKQHF